MLRMFRQLDEQRQNDESGFTLIELLVVIIIIGILAAIAIPVFLSQRERAWRSAVQSDLRNAVVSIETIFTDTGNYTVDAIVAPDPPVDGEIYLTDFGYNPTVNVTLALAVTGATAAEAQAYCLAGAHASNEDEIWYTGTGGTLSDDEAVGCPATEAANVTTPDPTA